MRCEFLIDNYIGGIGLENKVPMNCYPIGFMMISKIKCIFVQI